MAQAGHHHVNHLASEIRIILQQNHIPMMALIKNNFTENETDENVHDEVQATNVAT